MLAICDAQNMSVVQSFSEAKILNAKLNVW